MCVGGRHHSSTVSVETGVTKTGQKIVIGNCVQYERKKQWLLVITQ